MDDVRALARAATAVENGDYVPTEEGHGLIVGVTGPAGAGKSTLVDAMAQAWRGRGKTLAIVAVDPSSRMTGGAILGDRVRMQKHHADPGIFIRSMATRGAAGGIAAATSNMARLFRSAGFDYVVIETVGAGQDEIAVAGVADICCVVLTPQMGDDVQAIKAGIMEIASLFVVNKADLEGADRAVQEIEAERSVPVLKTVATEGAGVEALLNAIDAAPKNARSAERFEIDHLGIAVRSLDAALGFWEAQLGMRVETRETVAAEKVNVAMLPARIELLEGTSEDSTISRFVEKRGEGLHHVALGVGDLPAAVARLKSAGARVLNEPRRGAGGHLYVFVHPASTGGVLLELIQK
jgi:LAO/AO transport system kinase